MISNGCSGHKKAIYATIEQLISNQKAVHIGSKAEELFACKSGNYSLSQMYLSYCVG